MPPLLKPVIFTDEDTSARAILDFLSTKPVQTIPLTSMFPSGAKDEVWLPTVGKNRWILLSRNRRIRYTPRQIELVRKHKVLAFFLASNKNLSGDMMGDLVAKVFDEMLAFASQYAGPFLVKIMSNGKLVPWEAACPLVKK